MTASAVEKLLSCSTSWLEVADQLVQVCGESQVGKVMFGWAWQGVRSERVSKVIIEALKVFRKQQVTELLFNDYRARCWDGIKAMDNDLKTFHNLRTISVEYRGVPVKPLITKSEILFFSNCSCCIQGFLADFNACMPLHVLHYFFNIHPLESWQTHSYVHLCHVLILPVACSGEHAGQVH